MDKRTVASAHTRIDSLEKELIEVKTEVKIQFKEVFTRIKRIESLLIGAAINDNANTYTLTNNGTIYGTT